MRSSKRLLRTCSSIAGYSFLNLLITSGQERSAQGGEGSHSEAAAVEPGDFRQIRLGRGHLPQDSAGVRCENMPGIRGDHPPRLPLQKRLADFGFEPPKLLGNP